MFLIFLVAIKKDVSDLVYQMPFKYSKNSFYNMSNRIQKVKIPKENVTPYPPPHKKNRIHYVSLTYRVFINVLPVCHICHLIHLFIRSSYFQPTIPRYSAMQRYVPWDNWQGKSRSHE